MRVLLISSSSSSMGGGEFFLLFLGGALKKLGVEVGLWLSDSPHMDGIAEKFESIGPVLRHHYINTFKRNLRSFSHIGPLNSNHRKILKQWQGFLPDVIHINKQCLEDGLDLLELAAKWDMPQGCTIHITQKAVELNAFLGSVRDKIAIRSLKKYPGEIWGISQQRAEELSRHLGLQDVPRYVLNGVTIPARNLIQKERDRMREKFASFCTEDDLVVVALGRLEEQKNPMRFLEILELWKRECPALRGIWVGDGNMREAFDKEIQAMRAEGWIKCLGWQENPLPYLCLADVYLHPARFEGLPFALLEAMAHGKPCVLSPNLANELKDFPTDTWIIAHERDSSWLGKVNDLSFLNRLGEKSRHIVEESFSVMNMAKTYLDMYKRLIGRKRR